MLGDDDELLLGEGDSSSGHSLDPQRIPLDRAVVAQAQAHLREFSPRHRARWHRQIEAILHRFARAQGYRRQAVHIGADCTHIFWFPREGSGQPSADVPILLDPRLHSYPRYQSLAREISEQSGLAQLVIASLLVRRDWRLGDFASIHTARGIFDGAAPALGRIAHRYYRQLESPTNPVPANLLNISHAGANALKAKTAQRHEPILQRFEALKFAKTPQNHWTKLTLRALREQSLFPGKEDSALLRMIQRAKKAYLSRP